jgi:hypothetical protein
MTSTLSSVTLSEDIIFGGTAGADLLAGVRSAIMRIYAWLFMVGSGTVGGWEVAQKYRNEPRFPQSPTSELATLGAPKRKQRAPNLVRCPSTSTTCSYSITIPSSATYTFYTSVSYTPVFDKALRMATYQATASAPVNIACIKSVPPLLRITDITHLFFSELMTPSHFTLQPIRYWGKRNTKLILPTNSSLSVTLDQDHLRSTTSSRADASFEKDRLWLNGKEEEIERDGRLWVCIDALRKWRQEMEQADSGLDKVSV